MKDFYEHISVSYVTTTSNDKRYYSTLFSNDLLPPREGVLKYTTFCLIGG